MVGHYASFFTASAGASAAILGLLVVAVSVVNADDENPTTRELRTVLAGSAFVALVDIFLVSMVALTGGSVVFGLSSLAMAIVGLVATSPTLAGPDRPPASTPNARSRSTAAVTDYRMNPDRARPVTALASDYESKSNLAAPILLLSRGQPLARSGRPSSG